MSLPGPLSISERVWAIPHFRSSVISLLDRKQQLQCLALDWTTFRTTSEIIWRDASYHLFRRLESDGINQDRLAVYAAAVRDLDLTGSFALSLNNEGLPGLLKTFPGLVNFCSIPISGFRHPTLDQTISISVIKKVTIITKHYVSEPSLPTIDYLFLPDDWIIDQEFEIRLDLSGDSRSLSWFPSGRDGHYVGTLPPKFLGASLIKLEVIGELLGIQLIRLLQLRHKAGFRPLISIICPDMSPQYSDIHYIALYPGQSIEKIVLGNKSIGTHIGNFSMRGFLHTLEWTRFPQLRELQMVVRMQDWERDLFFYPPTPSRGPLRYRSALSTGSTVDNRDAEYHEIEEEDGSDDDGSKLQLRKQAMDDPPQPDSWQITNTAYRLPPPPLIPTQVTPLRNLRKLSILLHPHCIAGNQASRWSFWDAMPSLSELAVMFLSIVGPECDIKFEVTVHDEDNDDLEDWEFQVALLTTMLGRELDKLRGKRCTLRMIDPEEPF